MVTACERYGECRYLQYIVACFSQQCRLFILADCDLRVGSKRVDHFESLLSAYGSNLIVGAKKTSQECVRRGCTVPMASRDYFAHVMGSWSYHPDARVELVILHSRADDSFYCPHMLERKSPGPIFRGPALLRGSLSAAIPLFTTYATCPPRKPLFWQIRRIHAAKPRDCYPSRCYPHMHARV